MELFFQWVILDVEYITISPTHRCIRKICIKTRLKQIMELDFYPCKRYRNIEEKYKRSFRFCRAYIHRLSYNPKKYSPNCNKVLPLIKFIVDNDVEIIFYKRGPIEKDLCLVLDIASMNIECLEGIQKAKSHVPHEEVDCYFQQIENIIYCK